MPTGSMTNQVAIRCHTEPGDRVLMHGASHVVRSEGGAPAALSGVTCHPLDGERGIFTPEVVEAALGAPHRFNPRALVPPATLLCLENTHNGGGGSVWPVEALDAVVATARARGLRTHLDGARLWNAAAASGVEEARYAAPFDSVSVCFSKGLGAPVGSALAGDGELVTRARRFKQLFGGGFRQAGILAAGALHALRNHRACLGADHEKATHLARGLARLQGVDLDPATVETNIVRFDVVTGAGPFADGCHERGVHVLPSGSASVRAVTHRDVSMDDVTRALEVMTDVLAELGGGQAT